MFNKNQVEANFMPSIMLARYWVNKFAIMKLRFNKEKEVINLQTIHDFQLVQSAVKRIKWIRELLRDLSERQGSLEEEGIFKEDLTTLSSCEERAPG